MFEKIQVPPIPEANTAANVTAAKNAVVPFTPPSGGMSPRANKLNKTAEAVDRLLKFYPPLEMDDPGTFVTGIIDVLAEFPEDLIETATMPNGIPRRIKYLNNLAAIREACDELYAPIAREKRRQRERAEQAEPPLLPREGRANYANLKAKHGPNWGMQPREDVKGGAAKKQHDLQVRANKIFFERECAAAGFPKDSPISPSLAKKIRGEIK